MRSVQSEYPRNEDVDLLLAVFFAASLRLHVGKMHDEWPSVTLLFIPVSTDRIKSSVFDNGVI